MKLLHHWPIYVDFYTLIASLFDWCLFVFTAATPPSAEALSFNAPSIGDNAADLERPFVVDEVLKTLSGLDQKKGAGPDGLPPRFWKGTAAAISAPLTAIYNASLSTGVFPQLWKQAYITAIHKSGLRSKIENYRQISILSCLAKVMDNLMSQRLTCAFKNIISDKQHGFLKGRSTTTNLMEFVSKVTKSMEARKQVDALYLDFSKAFDSLNHQLLLLKLEKYGVNQAVIKWMKSYLVGRSSVVRIGNSLSQPISASSGVPQGSHIGPILFLIYVQDLSELLSGIDHSFYADDLKLSRTISSDVDQAALQCYLEIVASWGQRNDLKLNASKSQSITFSRRRSTVIYDYKLDGVTLSRVAQVKDLGVYLDSKLTFSHHYNRLIARCNIVLGLVKRFSREFDDLRVTKTLYCSLVRSVLEYAAPVWCPYQKIHMSRLESIQKKFLMFALGRQRLPDSYALVPYVNRLAAIGLDRICDR